MRLLSEKKKDEKKQQSTYRNSSNEHDHGVVEESSEPFGKPQRGYGYPQHTSIKEESENSLQDDKEYKLPSLYPKKNAQKTEISKEENKSFNQRRNFSAKKEDDDAKNKGMKGHSETRNMMELQQRLESDKRTLDRPINSSQERGASSKKVKDVSDGSLVLEKGSEIARPKSNIRGAPYSGLTKGTTRSKKKPVDPNGFEKWYQKNKNSGL